MHRLAVAAVVFAVFDPVARLDAGMQLQRELHPQRRYWLQVVRGAITAAARELAAGDAIGLVEEAGNLTVVATQATEVLLFDLP
jgi:redox-sensitive bicupin YhaK (pirin superfamily)